MAHKKTVVLTFTIIILFLSFLVAANYKKNTLFAANKDFVFQPSQEDIGNPERGFMNQIAVWVDKPYNSNSVAVINPTDRLTWVSLHLDNYRDPRDGKGVNLTDYQGKLIEPLGSGIGLDTVNNMFKDARLKGIKLVIRFMYIGYGGIGSQSDPNLAEPDAPLGLVQQHISQLAPLFRQNSDVIAAVQFGFVGYFGEWHSSKYLYSASARKAVMDAMLSAVPKDRMLQVRYPRYKQAFYGGPLTDSQAYNQSDIARIGLYDDAFLKDDTDDGTFKSTAGGTKVTTYCDGYPTGEAQCWRDFVAADGRYTPVGGEAGTHDTTASAMQQCPNALLQLSNMHWSFIHNGYSQVVLNAWQSGGCMPEIRRRLGYRFVLNKVTLPTQINRGATMPIAIYVTNEGFANMYNPRPFYLVFESMSTGAKTPVLIEGADPRKWFIQKTISQNIINFAPTVPSSLANGYYRVYFWLPDSSLSLQSNPNYAVRFANFNIWQAATGYNLIADNIVVGTTATPIGGNPADVNGDGSINIIDIGIIIDNYAKSPIPNLKADVNSDGVVNIIDIGIVIDNYGS